jgi:NADH dehydrogenase
VGASYGTIAAALKLKRSNPSADVVFINRTKTFVPRKYVADILSAQATEHDHAIYLAALCEKRGIVFREDNLKHIDTNAQTLELDNGERIHTDYLLIDLPYEPHSADVPGAEYAHSLSGITSAHALRRQVVHEIEQARNTNKAKHRTAIVVGGGKSGIETVCALRNLSLELSEKNFIFPYELEHIIINGHEVPDEIDAKAKKRISLKLEEQGIEWYDQPVASFSPESVVLGDRELETNTIIWTATPKGNRVFKETELPLTDKSFIKIDEYLRATPWLYAIGQSIIESGDKKLGERSGTALIAEGLAAANNITAQAKNQPLRVYLPRKDETRTVLLGKDNGFAWIGLFHCSGKFAAKLRASSEKRLTRAALNI